VVLVSIGTERPFIFTNKKTKATITIILSPGDILILKKSCNSKWTHERPPIATIKKASFSFTYRNLSQIHQ
jgi:alkylated DNA repair dioxygenase AlkB